MRKGTPLWIPIIVTATGALSAAVLSFVIGPAQAKALLTALIIILVGLALYNASFDAGKHVAGISAVLAVFIFIILILVSTNVMQQVVPICGDQVCAGNECREGCPDCKPENCADGFCQEEIESCSNSADCACLPGNVCDPARNNTDQRGCSEVSCGDKKCDYGESVSNCCSDCGCSSGYICKENTCLFLPPRMEVLTFQLLNRVGATTMAVAPQFYNKTSKTSQPLVAVVLKNSVSTAQNVTITFSIGNYVSSTTKIGDILPGNEATTLWYPKASREFLRIINTTQETVYVIISYNDVKGVPHFERKTFPITILARGAMGPFGDLTFYVTPSDVPVQSKTPERIWSEISEKVQLRSDGNIIQFPAETLYLGSGSGQDIALVLASAFQYAGLDPAFLQSGDETVVWVKDSDDFVILDPKKIGSSYENAIVKKIDSGIKATPIKEVWAEQNATPTSISVEFIPGALLRQQRNIEQTCTMTKATYTLTNDGLVDTPLCAQSVLIHQNQILTQKEWCISVPGKGQIHLAHEWSGNNNECIRPETLFTVEETYLR